MTAKLLPRLYRKVGGLHWFRLGRLRIALCWAKPSSALKLKSPPKPLEPH